MDSFRIQGGHRLAGHASIDGSKNATLPLMAAAILADEPVTLHGVPDLSDVRNMQNLLEKLGIEIQSPRPGTMVATTIDPNQVHAPYEIV